MEEDTPGGGGERKSGQRRSVCRQGGESCHMPLCQISLPFEADDNEDDDDDDDDVVGD